MTFRRDPPVEPFWRKMSTSMSLSKSAAMALGRDGLLKALIPEAAVRLTQPPVVLTKMSGLRLRSKSAMARSGKLARKLMGVTSRNLAVVVSMMLMRDDLGLAGD